MIIILEIVIKTIIIIMITIIRRIKKISYNLTKFLHYLTNTFTFYKNGSLSFPKKIFLKTLCLRESLQYQLICNYDPPYPVQCTMFLNIVRNIITSLILFNHVQEFLQRKYSYFRNSIQAQRGCYNGYKCNICPLALASSFILTSHKLSALPISSPSTLPPLPFFHPCSLLISFMKLSNHTFSCVCLNNHSFFIIQLPSCQSTLYHILFLLFEILYPGLYSAPPPISILFNLFPQSLCLPNSSIFSFHFP